MSLALLTLFLGAVSADVQRTDGSHVNGPIVRLTVDELVIEQLGRSDPIRLSTQEIQRISIANRKQLDSSQPERQSTNGQRAEIVLTDSSRLRANDVSSNGQTITLHGIWETKLEIARSKIQSARLTPLADSDVARWREFQAGNVAADQVAIKRPDRPLQSVEGVIGKLDKAALQFQFDGDWVNVKRNRVAGLVFLSPTKDAQLAPRCQLTTVAGDRFEVHELNFDSSKVQLTTANGLEFTLPSDQVAYVDFATNNVVYLSDLEPEHWNYESQLPIPPLINIENRWFQPRKNQTLTGRRLTTYSSNGQRTYQSGLGVHSQTEITYRLAGEYRRFAAVVTLDRLHGTGEVTIVVLTDDTEQLRETLTDRDPLSIGVNLIGVNRLTIQVEPASDGELCDHVSFCDARIIK